MLRRITSFLVVLAMLTGNVSSVVSATNLESSNEPAKNIEKNVENSNYEIYPLPQNQVYLGSYLNITEEVNLVIDSTIDEWTKEFVHEILSSKSIEVEVSNNIVNDKTNIIIGTNGSGEFVDTYVNGHINYDSKIYDEEDGYLLRIDEKIGDKGTIAILGEDTDSSYYGLATLKMIFDQIEGKEVKTLQFEDFADGKWRGFIEGFYGFPWSNEDRMSLMKFGGEFKMNSYIYAPKDEPYHNSKWRDPYPADKLAEIEELVKVGAKSKCEFVWAIHPGFNMINWNDYDNELNKLLAKFEQLYSVGVRQFGLFMDDISTSQSLVDKDKHVKLITDVANWVNAKEDCKPLIYCGPFYNQSWTGATGTPYLEALANIPENVEIMWTGKGVCGTVNETDMQWVKDRTGRDPYVWLNWPVNDYKDSRLMLGKGEVLKPGTHNIAGVVSNPMTHAELSKVALFAVADFSWNSDDFNDTQSWLDSFKYIAPEVAEEFKTIAYHLSDPAPSGHGLVLGESENIKEKLEAVLSRFNSEMEIGTAGDEIIAEFDIILNAIEVFRNNNTNETMVEEITPWLNCLQNVVNACKSATKSAMAIQNEDIGTAWEELAIATSEIAKSKTYTIPKYNYPDVTVEAGTKRLMPYVNELLGKLDTLVYTSMDPEAVVVSPITSYGNVSGIENILDGDDDSYVYIQTVQKNGDWFGVDFGKTIEVNDIRILQGRNDADHDRFQRGVLEYSVDGESWTAIGDERSDVEIVVDGLKVEARYVRYRLTHAGIPGGKPDLWTAIREFTVNKDAGKVSVYTNVDGLKGTAVTSNDLEAQITGLDNITLNKDEYLGIKLKAIDRIAEINMEASNLELTLETSENGVEWNEVIEGEGYKDAAYVRVINKAETAKNFNLSKLLVKLNKFTEPVVTHNYPGIYQGAIGNAFDGNLDNKVWFNGTQDAGKYVQVDLGGVVNVENIAVVINDGEGDYFREGDLQVSLDGKSWETVHTFSNPEDRALNFPTHEVPRRLKRVENINKQAKYVRLISTKNHNVWFALNEIIVNEGIGLPGMDNPAFTVSPEGARGQEALMVADKKLSTFFTPDGEAKAGYLNYKISQNTELDGLVILQSPGGISNAKVSVRDTKGWTEVGTLSKSYNYLDTSALDHVLEVKVEWDGSVKPIINEIISVKKSGEVVDPVVTGKTTITSSDKINVNETMDVTLGVSELSGTEAYAADFTFTYDPEVFEFKNVSEVRDGLFVMGSKVKDGEVRVIVSSLGAAITSNEDLAKVTLVAKNTAEETALSVTSSTIGDGEGNIHQLELANKNVKVEKVNEEIVVGKVSNLKASEVTNTTVELTWDAPATTAGLVEYVIYKDGKVIDTVKAEATSYKVTELRVNTIYGFKVVAKYSNGEESKPVSLNVRTTK